MKKSNSLPFWFKEHLKRMDKHIEQMDTIIADEKVMKAEMQKMLKDHHVLMRDHEGSLKARWMDVQELKGKR